MSVITYNQRELIGRALDSVLMQQTDFDLEIIVGDDCSSDGTREVLRDYARRFPDKIHLILHPRRYGGEVPGRTNNTTNLLNCRGRYTAMLDGDDFWTDPHKLQRQYDLLESRPEVVMCLHDARMEYHAMPEEDDYITRVSEKVGGTATGTYDHADLASRRVIAPHIGSLMFRTACRGQFPDWFYEIVAADYALLLLLSKHGAVYYDSRPDAAYYITPKSFQHVFRKNVAFLYQQLADIDTYLRHFPATYHNWQRTRGKAVIHWHLFQHHRSERNAGRALEHLFRMYRHDPAFGARMLINPYRKFRNYRRRRVASRASRSAENSAAMRS